MQDVHCQVLVIGGGAAAMRAAIAAHDAGADTLIVSKQTPGSSSLSERTRSIAKRPHFCSKIGRIQGVITCFRKEISHKQDV